MKKIVFYALDENAERGIIPDESTSSDSLVCDVSEVFEEELKEKVRVKSKESTSEEDLSYEIAEARKIHCFFA